MDSYIPNGRPKQYLDTLRRRDVPSAIARWRELIDQLLPIRGSGLLIEMAELEIGKIEKNGMVSMKEAAYQIGVDRVTLSRWRSRNERKRHVPTAGGIAMLSKWGGDDISTVLAHLAPLKENVAIQEAS